MELRGCLCCSDFRVIAIDEPGEDRRSTYKCCRGAVHIKRAALYVAISALLLSLFSTACLFYGVYSVNFWLDIVLIVLNTTAAIVLLYGLYIESANCMLPFIFVELLQMAGFFLLADYTLYFTIVSRQKFLRKFDQILMVVSIYIGIVIAGSAVWVAAKCYHYLKAKEANRSCDDEPVRNCKCWE